MNCSALYVKNIELAQVLMIKNEPLLAIVCVLGVGSGDRERERERITR